MANPFDFAERAARRRPVYDLGGSDVATVPGNSGYQVPANPTSPTSPTLAGAEWKPPTRQSDPLGTGQGFSYGNPGFDDPATKQYFDLMSQVVSRLTGGQNRSGEDYLTNIIQQMVGGGPAQGGTVKTGQIDPITGEELLYASDDPTGGGAGGVPRGTLPDNLSRYNTTLDQLMAQLQGPVFNDSNLASLRTNAFDQLNRDRQAEIQNTVRRLGGQGIAPNSPFIENAIRDVNRRYDTLDAQQRQGLNSFELNTQLQRPGQIADIASARFGAGNQVAGQQVGLAQILQQLSQQKRQEDLDNFSKALGLVGSGVSLTEGRINNVQNAGGVGDITALINAILGVSNATNAQNQTNALNNQQWYQMLGQLLAGIPSGKK